MPLTPVQRAALAKTLADLSGSFAQGNPAQEELATVLSDKTGGLLAAEQFNQRERKLSANLLSIVNTPTPGALQGESSGLAGANGRNPLAIPQAPGTRPEKTLGDVGLLDPLEIDPFEALFAGTESTQENIRQTQQERVRIEKALERQTDMSNRLKIIEQGQKFRERLAVLEMNLGIQRDIETGLAGARQQTTESTRLGNIQKKQAIEAAPSTEQAQQLTRSKVDRAISNQDIAATEKEFRERLLQNRVDEGQQGLQRGSAELGRDLATAMKAVSPAMLRQLRKRLAPDDLKQAADLFTKLETGELDEAGRQTVFDSLVSIMNEKEIQFFNEQMRLALDEIEGGEQPFRAIGLGRTLDPGPSIEGISEASVNDAVENARHEKDFLNR